MNRILIAEPSLELAQKILSAKEAAAYQFETARDGNETLKKIESFKPHLIYLDLFLPHIHGMEILKKVRAASSSVGVILASSNPMVQNYETALHEKADYFLSKPFEIAFLFELFSRFFQRALKPDPFSSQETTASAYLPTAKKPAAYLKFWGTRGSNPVSGADFIKFGGNTACLEVRSGEDQIIIDAGTGIRALGETMASAKTIHLFLSHTHWDHITGFPFLKPLYQSDCTIHIYSPLGFEKPTQELFTEMLAYAYFPVRIDDIAAKLLFHDLKDHSPLTIGSITLEAHYAYHPGATLCFKITIGRHTIAYATDNELFLGYHGHPSAIDKERLLAHKSLIDFFKGPSLFIHEAQYTPVEYQKKVGWGHSSLSNATALAKHTGAKEWIVTHHDPHHTDEELLQKLQLHKEILAECNIHCALEMAFDGLLIPIDL